MSAACKTILKTLHARGAKPPPWAGEWPPALTRMFYARRNWPTLLRRHPARRETAAQAADFPEAAFQTHGRPRHLPILGPLLGGRQFIALASIAIRPLASGQRRTVTGQLTSNPHPTSRIITGCPCGGTPRSRIHRQLRSPAAFLGLRAC